MYTQLLSKAGFRINPFQEGGSVARFLMLAALLLGLAACGGGGGDGAISMPTPAALRVTVTDAYGVKVADATVQATVGGSSAMATTDAQGIALLLFQDTFGTADVTVSRPTFLDKAVTATLVADTVTDVAVTLERATSPAGGSLTSRSGFVPSIGFNGQSVTFEIEFVVVDGNSAAIENLTAGDFTLRACVPDPANDRVDCVRGADASFDANYVPVTGTPETLALVPGAPASPYAAGLMLDQSSSIYTSDPTGARLYSAKAFLDGLGTDDLVLLSAFANGNGSLIPDKPLTLYPPLRDAASIASAPSYFSTLDSLAALVGGNTPLYAALDLMRQELADDTAIPVGMAKAVVMFTDGDDTDCADANACRTRRQQAIDTANAEQVRVFTIGLSSGVNFEALGELANKTGGAFLFADSAEQLIPLYGSVGKLLSLSLPTYRLRWTIQSGTVGAFQSGNALLGRVEVKVGNGQFDIPFVVGIP